MLFITTWQVILHVTPVTLEITHRRRCKASTEWTLVKAEGFLPLQKQDVFQEEGTKPQFSILLQF